MFSVVLWCQLPWPLLGRPGSGRPSALVPRGVGAVDKAASLLFTGARSLLGSGSMCKLSKHFQL